MCARVAQGLTTARCHCCKVCKSGNPRVILSALHMLKCKKMQFHLAQFAQMLCSDLRF